MNSAENNDRYNNTFFDKTDLRRHRLTFHEYVRSKVIDNLSDITIHTY